MTEKNKNYDGEKDTGDVSSKLLNTELEKISSGPAFGKRHIQVIILFFLTFIAFAFRVNLSVGIVAMTDPTSSKNPDIPTYNWTDKGIILSAFLWGYILPQVGAGWIATNYGPKWFLVIAMGLCSLGGFLIPPLAALFGSKGVMAVRALQGLSQGFIFPSLQNLLSKWVPKNERSRYATVVFSAGLNAGTVVSMLLSGVIASSWYGWPMIFYGFSSTGFIWCALFAYLGCNSPAQHSTITEEERRYIENGLNVSSTENTKKVATTPWIKICTSLPVWAVLVAQTGYVFMFWMLLTQIPNYMNNVMGFDIKSNSLLSSLPYIASVPMALSFASLSDLLVSKKVFSTGVNRKLFNSFGGLVPAALLVYLGNTRPDETTKAVVLLVLALSLSTAAMCGFMINQMDISPTHAGTLMGITNCISHITAIFAPLSVQFLVNDEKDPEQWKVIFYMTSIVILVSCTFFAIFGSGEVQHWNNADDEKEVADEAELVFARKLSGAV